MGTKRAEGKMESEMASLIGRRWGMLIVQQLSGGPHRFNLLKSSMPGIVERQAPE